MSATPTRTAFVLAGGGSLGAAQVGMLRELTAAGERPALIVGVSAGAINAAIFAAEPSAATVERMAGLWRSITTRRALGLSWRSLLGVIGLKDHIASPAGLRELLNAELGYEEFAHAMVPLHVVCADLLTGHEVVLSQGRVAEAVLASTAIPGVFPPVSVGARLLVDGAIASNTPIATAIRLGASRVIVLPAGFSCAVTRVAGGALGRAMHAITLLGARQLRHDFERYSPTIPIHIVPPLCPVGHSSYDYAHGAALIERGQSSTRAWLEAGGLARTDFPGPLEIHSH